MAEIQDKQIESWARHFGLEEPKRVPAPPFMGRELTIINTRNRSDSLILSGGRISSAFFTLPETKNELQIYFCRQPRDQFRGEVELSIKTGSEEFRPEKTVGIATVFNEYPDITRRPAFRMMMDLLEKERA